MNFLANAWANFQAKMIDKKASKEQRRALRVAFYCGAVSYYTVMEQLSDPKTAESSGVEALASLNKEIRAFIREMDK